MYPGGENHPRLRWFNYWPNPTCLPVTRYVNEALLNQSQPSQLSPVQVPTLAHGIMRDKRVLFSLTTFWVVCPTSTPDYSGLNRKKFIVFHNRKYRGKQFRHGAEHRDVAPGPSHLSILLSLKAGFSLLLAASWSPSGCSSSKSEFQETKRRQGKRKKGKKLSPSKDVPFIAKEKSSPGAFTYMSLVRSEQHGQL